MKTSIITAIVVLSTALSSAMSADQPNQHPHPFQTMQPDGTVVTLSYRGDDEFNWYEDADGYTVLDARGRFVYATLGANGELIATDHLVGRANPAALGLAPHMLPSPKTIARLRSKARERIASQIAPLNDRIPADSRLIDGCIMVRNTPQSDDSSGGAGVQDGVSQTTNFWTDGLIYYTFDSTVTSEMREAIREAMDSWQAVANVQFIQRTNQPNYIYIFIGTGNWSYVGMIGGRQDLSLVNWNYKYIVMHELAHAMGVWHEQSRADRDSYIQVNLGNVQTGKENNFDVQNGAQTHGDYDFDSIMHYGQCAFANCTCSSACRTIECLPPYQSWQSQIGQKTHLSLGDAANMAFLYGSPNTTSGMAQMTNPATNGAYIAGGSITFTWTTGSQVQEYRLRVGSAAGLGNFYDATGNMTSATVGGLPIEGGNVHVQLYSKIDGTWYHNSYAYTTDLCPGHPDSADADGDGVPDGCDICPGFDDAIDSDGDGVPDGCDVCPGHDDRADLDGDGVPDGCDTCPIGDNNIDTDGDDVPDACDECPNIHNSLDSDGDGVPDCLDGCPNDANKTSPGICGCGVPDTDSDGDGTPDCNDNCPFDATKLEPGADGCNATEPITGGDIAGGGPTGGSGGATFGLCGGGSAAALSTLMLSMLCLRTRRRRRA